MKRRVHNTLEEDVKHLIEAAIVRILKYKRELEVFVFMLFHYLVSILFFYTYLKHELLVPEVIHKLENRFISTSELFQARTAYLCAN